MPGLMVQFHHPSGPPTMAQAAARLEVPQAALDASFGVIAIDPAEHLYTVLIEAAAADKALAAIGRKARQGRTRNEAQIGPAGARR